MGDLLAAVVVVALLASAGLVLLVLLTVVPFVVALQRADRQGCSPARTGAVAMAGSLLGLALAGVQSRAGAPPPLVALPLLLALVGPLAARAVPRWLGRRGGHEPRDV